MFIDYKSLKSAKAAFKGLHKRTVPELTTHKFELEWSAITKKAVADLSMKIKQQKQEEEQKRAAEQREKEEEEELFGVDDQPKSDPPSARSNLITDLLINNETNTEAPVTLEPITVSSLVQSVCSAFNLDTQENKIYGDLRDAFLQGFTLSEQAHTVVFDFMSVPCLAATHRV
ncbi:hypothetical protein GNI_128660 [Gregarina niphandrodes]|uniref:Uncharacterized protein n=1 Tax=Gregarina niphandrodes TaxID=110365 RepID=A0A023B1W3_GRENI|nr:hypothetical protein GNI_128660 [Gregarina niphandrodes]EZG48583.1 hypothetical protein GNI_128660 [Gregarina niphandrodes]|eukprot:XP_011132087.1 hypothetical protein GNI_128660 [Gregarina niphandrodes]